MEVSSIITLKTTTYEKIRVWWIIKKWMKKDLNPIYKTTIVWPMITSSNVLGPSDYQAYCTFKVGKKKTWAYIVVQDDMVNNKKVTKELLEEEFSELDLLKQSRKKTLKGLLR